jgi:hypothetical protein
LIFEQWCTLAVLTDDGTLLSSAVLLTKETRNRHQQGEQDEAAHDHECKDPLECEGLGSDLCQSKSYRWLERHC